jgi:hypothetical protein
LTSRVIGSFFKDRQATIDELCRAALLPCA